MIQKIKFTIKGMHCESCARLIEEKMKDKPGIIKTKVNNESEKGVIIYDDQKITEAEIETFIKETGNFQLEKIQDEPEIQKLVNPQIREKEENCQGPKEVIPLLRRLMGFVTISLIINIILLGVVVAKLPNGNTPLAKNNITNQGTNLPSQNPAPTTGVQTFNITKDNHIRGDINAPITLVEFSDFQCPFCERHYPTLKKLADDYPGKVRLVYKHFPLSFHENAQKAAEASECASEQGKFWEYHDKIFDNQNNLSLANLKQWAVNLGLNSQTFNSCLDNDKYADKVNADAQEGASKGVNGTPATFVNGQLVTGAQPYETFKQEIDKILNQN